MKKDFSKKIIKKIKEEKIVPRPKWQFILKNYFIWSFFVISIAIGSLASSIIIFSIKNNEWDIYKNLNKTFLEYLVVNLPYFWIFVILIFIGVAYLDFRHTKSGYKYKSYFIVLFSILISLAIGYSSYELGVGTKIDQLFRDNLPYYHSMMGQGENVEKVWMQPEKGLLMGEITSVSGQNSFSFKDLDDNVWEIQGDKMDWRGATKLEVGEKIRMTGQKQTNSTFKAETIRPWPQNNNHNNKQKRNGYGKNNQ